MVQTIFVIAFSVVFFSLMAYVLDTGVLEKQACLEDCVRMVASVLKENAAGLLRFQMLEPLL